MFVCVYYCVYVYGDVPHCVCGVFDGGGNTFAVRCCEEADYRLCVFSQIEARYPGGITGKKFFCPDKSVLSGHYNLEINF